MLSDGGAETGWEVVAWVLALVAHVVCMVELRQTTAAGNAREKGRTTDELDRLKFRVVGGLGRRKVSEE